MAKRLEKALNEKNGGNQSELARFVGVSPQAVQKWITGATEPKGKNLRLAAKFLGISAAALQYGDDAALDMPTDLLVVREAEMPYVVKKLRRSSDDEATIEISNASASMGLGIPILDHEHSVATMRVARSWLHSTLPKITSVDNLAILTAYGESMFPTFGDGDLLLVDRGVTAIDRDAVYVLAKNKELYVKRLHRRYSDDAIVIKSDNPLHGPDDVITNGDRANLEILGRVVWAWNGRKL